MSELIRCPWCGTDALYTEYHDKEWGVPLHDDDKLFEFLLLESFQAGLSWLTILRKRENFSKAFAEFNPQKIVHFNESDIDRLLNDAGIVRNKLKINAAINNASRFLAIQEKFGSFDKFLWQFINFGTIDHKFEHISQLPAVTKEAEEMSKALLSNGFKFVGPTICYANMQAIGMVNDHLISCYRHTELLAKI